MYVYTCCKEKPASFYTLKYDADFLFKFQKVLIRFSISRNYNTD